MKARFNNTVIAESDNAVKIEGKFYFPPDSVKMEFLTQSDFHIRSPRKGEANFYNITADGEWISDAAWYYPAPEDATLPIKDYVAFWKAVEVVE